MLTAAGVYLPEGRHPIIPVVSAANLSSLYRNFHFAPYWCSLFTVVRFPGVRCIISNLKGFSRALTRKRMKTNTTELRSILVLIGGELFVFNRFGVVFTFSLCNKVIGKI
jgi:hypothetical protein